MNGAGGISVHAVDVSTGKPAAGLRIRLLRSDASGEVIVAEGACTETGVLDHSCATGAGIVAGRYVAEFDVAGYCRSGGADLPEPAFLDIVRYSFGVADAAQHYHLPFKFTPWGFSLFRGGL